MLGAKYAVAVSNCTAALHVALMMVGVKEGDEVLVSDYTFPAAGHAVLYCGAKPVFVDVDPLTYNIDPDLMADKITQKTVAVIPVHAFGQPARMDDINYVAKEHGLKVIEDAACAFGAKHKGKMAGTLSDVGCFSFHGTKNIAIGEGGMLVTNSAEFNTMARHLSVVGLVPTWDREQSPTLIVSQFNDLAYNYRMSDVSAAVGIAQLGKFDEIIYEKRLLAAEWDKVLQDIDFIESPYVDKDMFHVYQSYTALVSKEIDRNKLINLLRARGVQTAIGVYASHIQPVYKSTDSCPVSLDIFNRSLRLPIYYGLSIEKIHAAAKEIKETLYMMRKK